MRIYQVRSAVGRPVVNDDNFQIRIVARQDMVDRADNDLGLIMRGDQHRLQRWRFGQERRDAAGLGLPIAPCDGGEEQDPCHTEPDSQHENHGGEMA